MKDKLLTYAHKKCKHMKLSLLKKVEPTIHWQSNTVESRSYIEGTMIQHQDHITKRVSSEYCSSSMFSVSSSPLLSYSRRAPVRARSAIRADVQTPLIGTSTCFLFQCIVQLDKEHVSELERSCLIFLQSVNSLFERKHTWCLPSTWPIKNRLIPLMTILSQKIRIFCVWG